MVVRVACDCWHGWRQLALARPHHHRLFARRDPL